MGTVTTVAMRFVLPTDNDGASKNPTIRQKTHTKNKKIILESPTSKKKSTIKAPGMPLAASGIPPL